MNNVFSCARKDICHYIVEMLIVFGLGAPDGEDKLPLVIQCFASDKKVFYVAGKVFARAEETKSFRVGW